jgi:release factor glutamine methyltransferase
VAGLALAGETVGQAVRRGAARLRAAGVETARLDAELLLAEVLGVGRERLVVDRDAALAAGAAKRFAELLARREAREPVAYILGRREFRRIVLELDRRVLIPRPETELLVEVGLELGQGMSVADVGTGSGAVALALADERPDLNLAGLDADSEALSVARCNGRRLGLGVQFFESDLLGDLEFDAVLANLPYVPCGAELAPEIMGYEPRGALFGGADGLDLVRRLIDELPAATGMVALEIGGGAQAAEVSRLVGAAGFGSVEVRRDLAGIDRVVVGRR